MTAALLWLSALAEDFSGAPEGAKAAFGALAVAAAVVVCWGAVLELRVRAFDRQAKAAARLSRCLFAAAGMKRWRRKN